MNRQEKEGLVDGLRTKLQEAEFVAVAQNHGISVSDASSLRKKVRSEGGSYKVAKNTLMKIAAKGTEAEKMADLFMGPTGVFYAQDPVSLSKVLIEFTKSNDKLTLLGGLLAGKLLSDADILALSKMPSLQELLATIVGFIQGAANHLKQMIEGPAVELHRIIEAIAKKED